MRTLTVYGFFDKPIPDTHGSRAGSAFPVLCALVLRELRSPFMPFAFTVGSNSFPRILHSFGPVYLSVTWITATFGKNMAVLYTVITHPLPTDPRPGTQLTLSSSFSASEHSRAELSRARAAFLSVTFHITADQAIPAQMTSSYQLIPNVCIDTFPRAVYRCCGWNQ